MMRPELLDRTPPHDIDAEKGLLGALVVDPSELDRVISVVDSRDFYDRDHGLLYGALGMLHEARQPMNDPIVLVPALRRLHVPESMTSVVFIGGLFGNGIASNALYYATRIRKLSVLRGFLDTAMELIQRSHAPEAEPESISQWLETRRDAFMATQKTAVRRFGDIAFEVLDELDKPADTIGGVMTGVESIDHVIGAMLPGEVTILAARTGVGKTSLAVQVASYSAMNQRATLYCSLEMTERELVQRELCAEAGVNNMRVRTRRIDPTERKRLVDASIQLGQMPLWLWSPASATFNRLRAVAKVHHAQQTLRLIVVDYIGLVSRDDWRIQEHEHIARVSTGLKQMAKEFGVPVLALAQLNREADKDESPRLSQLAKSGAIEQDADVVLILHRPKANTTDTECIIAKNRHGSTGKFKLAFDARRTRFATVEPERHNEFDDFNNR